MYRAILTPIKKISGFTIAELLIGLAIIALIAIFTIPNVLNSMQGQEDKRITQDAIKRIQSAYQKYRLNANATSATTFANITPYLNYARVETAKVVDDMQTTGTHTCGGSGYVCVELDTGASIFYHPFMTFNTADSVGCISLYIDPDNKETVVGSTNGPGKSVPIFLFYDGKIRDRSRLTVNCVSSFNTYTNVSTFVPPWFDYN